MVIGLSGFAISTLLIALVIFLYQQGWIASFLILPLLIISRSIFGIFGSGTMPAAQAYMADRTTRNKRAVGASAITASFGIGNVIGPGFAASLIFLSFLAPFIFVGGLGLLVALMIFIFFARTIAQNHPKPKGEENRLLGFAISLIHRDGDFVKLCSSGFNPAFRLLFYR